MSLSEIGDEELFGVVMGENIDSLNNNQKELLRRLSQLRAAEKVVEAANDYFKSHAEIEKAEIAESYDDEKYKIALKQNMDDWPKFRKALDEFNALKRKEATDGKDTL